MYSEENVVRVLLQEKYISTDFTPQEWQDHWQKSQAAFRKIDELFGERK